MYTQLFISRFTLLTLISMGRKDKNAMLIHKICHKKQVYSRKLTKLQFTWNWWFLVFHYVIWKTTVFNRQNLNLMQIGWKAPPPSFLLFGERPGLHRVKWHNFAKPYFMHHWTSHWGPGRKAPLSSQRGTYSETESIHFMQFPETLVQLPEKPLYQLFKIHIQKYRIMVQVEGLYVALPQYTLISLLSL